MAVQIFVINVLRDALQALSLKNILKIQPEYFIANLRPDFISLVHDFPRGAGEVKIPGGGDLFVMIFNLCRS